MALRHKAWSVAVLLAVLLVLIPGTVAFAQAPGGDQVIVGRDYALGQGQQLSGNLTVVGGHVNLAEGSLVNGDVSVVGGTLVASGSIQGNLSSWGATVSLTRTAVVRGDLATFGGSVRRDPGAVVSGRVVDGFGTAAPGGALPLERQRPSVRVNGGTSGGPLAALGGLLRWQVTTVAWALFLALLGVGAVLVAPRNVERVARTARAEPALSFGLGLLTLIVAGLAGTALIIICGLGLLVLLATLVALALGWIAIGLWVGQRLLAVLKLRSTGALLDVALGVFLISVIARLPFCIGFLFGLVVGLIGLGAVVLTRFGRQDYRRADSLPAGSRSGGELAAGSTVPPAPETGGPATSSASPEPDAPDI